MEVVNGSSVGWLLQVCFPRLVFEVHRKRMQKEEVSDKLCMHLKCAVTGLA